MTEVRTLEPSALWNYFSDLNAIPRPSKKEERVIAFMMDFGKKLGLETSKDETGNVIIRKPATKGMEDRVTVALQSHLDMVHQKNRDTAFDFSQQGIEMYVDGDWVKAKGTTLGADNGIGVATIMTILAASDIPHPKLEALFTIDEETGMTGAMGLKGGVLNAKILLNLDTEEDNELTIGCAGGIDVTANGTYITEPVPQEVSAFRFTLKGLTGGHSGTEIQKGRGNANKLMNRILSEVTGQFHARICKIEGGGLRNAIPRESMAELVVPGKFGSEIIGFISRMGAVLKAEYHITDPNIVIVCENIEIPDSVLEIDFQTQLLRTLYACPNGIYRMSPDIEGLIQTSNNIAKVLVKEGTYSIQCLTRSSVETEKMDLANAIKCTFELAGASVTYKGGYPGWVPDPGAPIVKLMRDLYKELYNEEPIVDACHAGLECGILGANYPGMEMISFGPNIYGAHSPDEKVQISSVQKFWSFLQETLKRIPVNS